MRPPRTVASVTVDGSPSAGVRFWRDAWIVVSLFLFIALRSAYYSRVASGLPPLGDEVFYYQNSSVVLHALGSLVRGDIVAALRTASALIERGWFLPGMSIVLAPVRAMSDSFAVARLYMGALNSLLLLLCVRRLAGTFGMRAARIALAIIAVFPYHAAFSFTFWGDLPAGHALFYLSLVLVETQRHIERYGFVRLRRWVALGALMVAIIYVRPGLILLAPAILLFAWLFHLPRSTAWRAAAVRHAAVAGLLIAATVALGLAPWSYAISKKFGGVFITTTSIDLNVIYAFGPATWQADIPLGENKWTFIYDSIQRRADSTGATFWQASTAWRAEVVRSLTLTTYSGFVRQNLVAFFLDENRFLIRFATSDDPKPLDPFNRYLLILNTVLWRSALAVGVLLLLWPWRLVGPGWWLGLSYRAMFCGVASQPFLSDSGGRYYVILIPLIAASAGVAAVAVSQAAGPRLAAPTGGYDAGGGTKAKGLFRFIEWAMPATIALVLALTVGSAL